MAEIQKSPYVCHVFVCTNDRGGERKSCADSDSPAVRKALKGEISSRGWKGRVRVSSSGCMGLCAKGANVILYPQGIWFSNVVPNDVGLIVSKIEKIMEEKA